MTKGGPELLLYRSRFVGREHSDHNSDTLYASTPPIEAMRFIVSHASIIPSAGQPTFGPMVDDLRRAYLYAPARRNVHAVCRMQARTPRRET